MLDNQVTKYLIKTTPKKNNNNKKKTGHNNKMEFSHVFYKEILLDEDNIFSASPTKNNGVEQVKFEKSKITQSVRY